MRKTLFCFLNTIEQISLTRSKSRKFSREEAPHMLHSRQKKLKKLQSKAHIHSRKNSLFQYCNSTIML